MSISLSQILALVGSLDDSPGDDTARERFRRFLKDNVHEVGEIRDHIEECLRTSGDQYNRALQDLTNYIGTFLGFTVTFGRYRGVQNEIGFDGLWVSPTGLHIVVEVKTTETYAIKTSTLLNYVNELISEKRMPSWDTALGLYVVGRPDPQQRQLENSILAERVTHQLRIASVESLLSLAEIKSDYDVSHEDILVVLRPSKPGIDPLADLIARLLAQRTANEPEPVSVTAIPSPVVVTGVAADTSGVRYWLTPVTDHEGETASECVQNLIGKHKIYAFGQRTPGRAQLKKGDKLCFYATGKGVIAHATAASAPENKIDSRIRFANEYPWVFEIEDPHLYLASPIIIDAALRQQLDEFKARDITRPWAWFVQANRSVTEHDFLLLTQAK